MCGSSELIIGLSVQTCVPRSLALLVLVAFCLLVVTLGAWGSSERLCLFLNVSQSHSFLGSFFLTGAVIKQKILSLSQDPQMSISCFSFPLLVGDCKDGKGESILFPKSALGLKTWHSSG